jgi:hypothetical protein
MSKAGDALERAIKDTENLLDLFSKVHSAGGHPPPETEGGELFRDLRRLKIAANSRSDRVLTDRCAAASLSH